MPHVTFIHGIGNKPAAAVLLGIWRRSLAQGDGLDLGAEGVTSSMVYWADVMYDKPDAEEAAHESTDSVMHRDDLDIDMSWREKLIGQEKQRVEALATKLNLDAPGDDDFEPPESDIGVEFERIPLPWRVKRRYMEAHLRDVHHYLFNAVHSPRPGVSYRVRDEIRSRMVARLREGAQRPGPHIVISHSMGTVIAYDCLKRVPDCPRVDALMTIGSPLGLDEIQDLLKPEWTRNDGFPSERLTGGWANVFDRLDPVAGLDPNIANDYQRRTKQVIEDINEQNYGKWRHDISKYLSGSKLRAKLTEMLGF